MALYHAPGFNWNLGANQQLSAPPAKAFDQSTLIAALNNVAASQAGTGDWIINSGASSHMASHPGILQSPSPPPILGHIIVGNGHHLPISHAGTSFIPTSRSNLYLNNVLVSTALLVKNLISVRKLTCDNSVSIEFEPYGFSIKDLLTGRALLRCDSEGDLYPLRLPSATNLHASSTAVLLWHQRLGHPSRNSCASVLNSFEFSCNKTESHVCPACQKGKQTRLPFSISESVTYFPFQLLHSDVWTSSFQVFLDINIILLSWMTTHSMRGHSLCDANQKFYLCCLPCLCVHSISSAHCCLSN